MEANRKHWNQQQKKLRKMLESSGDFDKAIELFLDQHAMVHSKKVSKTDLFSFEDDILNDLKEKDFRFIPKKGNHSIAWIIWHLARIEDVTMNLLVVGSKQLLRLKEWNKKLKLSLLHTGNGMSDEDIVKFSSKIDINALKAYRIAVGKNTRKIVKKLRPEKIYQKVDPLRVQQIWKEKAMLENAAVIINYWSKRTIAGLLLMPPTRHCFLHLNEARRIKEKF